MTYKIKYLPFTTLALFLTLFLSSHSVLAAPQEEEYLLRETRRALRENSGDALATVRSSCRLAAYDAEVLNKLTPSEHLNFYRIALNAEEKIKTALPLGYLEEKLTPFSVSFLEHIETSGNPEIDKENGRLLVTLGNRCAFKHGGAPEEIYEVKCTYYQAARKLGYVVVDPMISGELLEAYEARVRASG